MYNKRDPPVSSIKQIGIPGVSCPACFHFPLPSLILMPVFTASQVCGSADRGSQWPLTSNWLVLNAASSLSLSEHSTAISAHPAKPGCTSGLCVYREGLSGSSHQTCQVLFFGSTHRSLTHPTTNPDSPAIPHCISGLCVCRENDPMAAPSKCWCCMQCHPRACFCIPLPVLIPLLSLAASQVCVCREGTFIHSHQTGQCCLQRLLL